MAKPVKHRDAAETEPAEQRNRAWKEEQIPTEVDAWINSIGKVEEEPVPSSGR
jgi:hypothetical protein